MTNVLPTEALQAELGRFKNRLLLVGSLVFFGIAILSALALLPSHVALQVENKDLSQQGIGGSGTVPEANKEAAERSGIVRAQALIDRIAPIVSGTSTPSEAISAALALRPPGVLVDHISYVSGADETIMIYGISTERESIHKYRETLSNSGHFKNTSVPVGALVGTEGGKFTITLSGIL